MEVNILDHGADPTGGTDSTISIQAAIDALDPANCVLNVPSGRYRVNAMLNLGNRSNVTINARSATFELQDAVAGNPGQYAVLNIHNCTGFLLDGLTIEIDGSQAYSGINVAASVNGKIRDVTTVCARNAATRGWVGITVFDPVARTSRNISITGCTVSDFRFGISVNGIDIRITDSFVGMPGLPIEQGYFDGIMVLAGADRVTVAHCDVIKCGAAGVWTEPCTRLNVDGNTVVGTLGRGIEVAATGAAIIGNVVRDCYGNINLLDCRDVTVTGNQVENAVASRPVTCLAINEGSTYILAVGNYFRQASTTHAAIWAWPGAIGITLGPNGIVGAVKYSVPAGVRIIP